MTRFRLRRVRRTLARPTSVRQTLAGAALAAVAGLFAAAPLGAGDPLLNPPPRPVAAPAAGVADEDRPFLHQEGYVYLNAPLYPSPRQDIPIQVGGTMITNPAFAPHEYLYAHDYNALYGPFYHRARGGWVITPWGVRTNERWDLVGTQVKVKYRSKIPFFTGFSAPFNRRETLFDNEWANTGIGSPATGSPNFHH